MLLRGCLSLHATSSSSLPSPEAGALAASHRSERRSEPRHLDRTFQTWKWEERHILKYDTGKKEKPFSACSSHHFCHLDYWWWSAVSTEPLRCAWTTSGGVSQRSLLWPSSPSFLLPQLLQVQLLLSPARLAAPLHTCPPSPPSAASESLQRPPRQPESPCIPKQSDPGPDSDWGLFSLNWNSASGSPSHHSRPHSLCILYLSLYLRLIKGPPAWRYQYLRVGLSAGPSQQWIERGVKRCFPEAPDGTWQARPPNTADTLINSAGRANGTLKNTSTKETVRI